MCIICNNYGKNLAYLKPPDSVQRAVVSRHGVKTLVCIFWNSSGVFRNRPYKMSLVATPYAKYDTKLLGTIVPTTTRHRKIAGFYVWKKMLVSTRQIKEKLLFDIKFLRLSPLSI